MVHGVGIDLVQLDRFERFAHDHAARLPEMFTAGERASHRLAEAFAVKEAALKAIGGLTGWELDWREIDATDPALVKVTGEVAKHARKIGCGALHGSVHRERGAGSGVVLATVIAESRA